MSIWSRWDNVVAPKAAIKTILPKYCGRCGKALVRQEQSLGFHNQTGIEQFQYWLRCPDTERPDTPYAPSWTTSRARYVLCDLSGWAEDEDKYGFSHHVGFVSCEPWPKPVTTRAKRSAA